MILNKELIDPKDFKIKSLQMTIERFKKYDKDRQKYYADIVAKASANEEYIHELENGIGIDKLSLENKKLREELAKINARISASKIVLTDDEYEMCKNINTFHSLKSENKHLREKVKKLQQDNTNLICKLV